MRNASKMMIAAVAALSLSACVNNEQASTEPPGETFSAPAPRSESSEPPSSSEAPPSDGSTAPAGAECTAEDIQVVGAVGAKPQVTVPTSCAAPTSLLVKDLVPGTGAEAAKGAAMQAHYYLAKWSDGQEVETNFGQEPIPVETVGEGLIEAWNQGLVGMKQGGRRLLVAPPDLAYGSDPSSPLAKETLVFVIDATAVTAQ